MDVLHHRLPAFLANLDHLDAQGQHDAFVNEVIENFGRFAAPAGDRSHRWELDLHGISADGATDEEAMANWKRLARQQCEQGGIAQALTGASPIGLPAQQIGGA